MCDFNLACGCAINGKSNVVRLDGKRMQTSLIRPDIRPLTNKLKESLNFWKMSMYSGSLGARALIDSIPSPCSFFFDLRDLINHKYRINDTSLVSNCQTF